MNFERTTDYEQEQLQKETPNPSKKVIIVSLSWKNLHNMLHSSLMVFFALCHLGHLNLAEGENKSNPSCPRTFSCGKLDRINFPFSNYSHPPSCGVLKVDGCQKDVQRIQLDRDGSWYEIFSIDQANTIFIRDKVFQEHLNSNSCETFNNLTFSRLPFLSFQILHNVSLYKCDHPAEDSLGLDLVYSGCSNFRIYRAPVQMKLPTLPPSCSLIQLPSKLNPSKSSNIFLELNASFSLQVKVSPPCYECHYRKRGECQVINEKEFYCAYATEGSEVSGTAKIVDCFGNRRLGLRIGLGAGASVAGFGALVIAGFFLTRKYSLISSFCSKGRGGKHDVEEFLKSCGTLAPKRFSYSEIKKITKSFREKLGKGGYGEVFKGKLPDGSLVAVKVLTKSKTNGEDFINEVASIGRTSHVNIVTLLGFCFEGSKRALIYEFMSGGSLEKYIYEESYSNDDRQLGWETSLDIAIGIARGLEYLHRGCNTRILHFDIKPHNILLDENFCPKVSDFGLAKICPQRESIISMVGARGTAGYIAPEVFCRNFGGVSHKSDVYSYGMMVLEMVGGRKNIRVEVENSSEIYFPHWIHKRLELGEDLGLCGTRNVEERQIAKKMILVSLWCIQTNPSDRPAMGRVVEMLQGSLESIPIPPKPYLSSPSGSQQISVSSSPSTSILTGQISEQVIKEVMG